MSFKKEMKRIKELKSHEEAIEAYDELRKKIDKEEKFWIIVKFGFVLFTILLLIIMVISKI